MSIEKQIEEMARDIFAPKVAIDGIDIAFASVHGADKPDSHFMRIAQHLYNAGYRKQSEGEWIAKTDYAGYGYYCSNCNAVFTGENAEWMAKEHIYCPKCGAKMKGDTE